jgi:hypothetical protein
MLTTAGATLSTTSTISLRREERGAAGRGAAAMAARSKEARKRVFLTGRRTMGVIEAFLGNCYALTPACRPLASRDVACGHGRR